MNNMTREDLFKHHSELCKAAFDILVAKNNDYASGKDPFSNFRKGEIFNLCSTEVGILLRITDKMSRLSTFAKDGKLSVENEGYRDAILDIMNYCVLFSAYVKSKEETCKKQ
jgi:hypothetical protein